MKKEKKGTRIIFDSGIIVSAEEKQEAAQRAINFLTKNIGVNVDIAHETIGHELEHSMADMGGVE